MSTSAVRLWEQIKCVPRRARHSCPCKEPRSRRPSNDQNQDPIPLWTRVVGM